MLLLLLYHAVVILFSYCPFLSCCLVACCIVVYCLVVLLSCSLVVCRYASLYFLAAIEPGDNELVTLEVIHRFVELLDKYFGNVSDV